MKEQSSGNIILLIPVYNDWESVELLLPAVDRALAEYPTPVHVLLVDDGSTVPVPAQGLEANYQHINRIDVLRLRRNVGHQRAIAVGLCHVLDSAPGNAVLIMDGDGEDRPEDVPRLLREFYRQGGETVLFSARTRRLESLTFQLFYRLYQLLHWMLTGIPVRVGNFSVLPGRAVARLVVVSDLWNHYAAAVVRSRIPYSMLPLPRGTRLRGVSTMDFFALVAHGFSAISVFGDIVSVRLLAASMLPVIALSVLLVSTAGSPVGLWVALMIAVQLFLSALLLVFATIGSRSKMSFLPLRDAHFFILEVHPVFLAHERVQLHRLRVGHL